MREAQRLLDPVDLWGRIQFETVKRLPPEVQDAGWEMVAARSFRPAPKYLN